MFRATLLALSVLPIMAATLRPHAANCSMRLDPNTRALEISCRIDLNDLGTALQLRTGQDLRLGEANEAQGADSVIAQYLREHLQLTRHDTALTISYLGRENLPGQTAVYLLQTSPIVSTEGLTVRCDILQELYSDQLNVVRVETEEGWESYTFTQGSGTYTFGMGDD